MIEGVSFFDSLSSYRPSVIVRLNDRLIKVGARVSYHAHRWYVPVASAFPSGAPLPGGAGLGGP